MSSNSSSKTTSTNRFIDAIVHNKKVILVALSILLALTNFQQRQLRSYLRRDGYSYTALSNDIDSSQSKGLQHNNADAPSQSTVLPSWAIATQCSLYHTDCPNHLHFQEYPFLLQHDDQSNSNSNTTIISKAKEYLQEFKTHNSSNNHHRINYIYPPKASPSTQQTCLTSTQNLPIETQLDQLLPRLTPLQNTHNMIAFSMTDQTYATTMLHDIYEMNSEIVGFRNAFFFVAMDTHTARMACEYGYPVIAMPTQPDLKKQVQSTKVLISKLLVERQQSFLFFEMDVWFVRSPISMLQREMMNYDFLCSTHQWNPGELNIGFYAALANNGTINYFRDSLEVIESNPLAHDQKILHAVADDNTATLENRTVEDHLNCGWCGDERVSFQGVKATHPIRVGRLDPHVVVSSVTPIPTEGMIALHTLADMPLEGPFGKQMVAKELGVWYGFGKATSKAGYYHREGVHRRYLLLENPGTRGGQSFVQMDGYHDPQTFQRQIAVLVSLAKATNRILVLPQVLGDFYAQPLWMYLDMKSVEDLGVVYRETNFAYNKKAWLSPSTAFGSVTQMAIVESLKEIQLLTESGMEGNSGIGSSPSTFISDRIPLSSFGTKRDPLTSFFAVAASHPQIKDSEALFVNLDYFQRNQHVSKQMRKLEGILAWCDWDMGPGSRFNSAAATSVSSTHHCYGKGKVA